MKKPLSQEMLEEMSRIKGSLPPSIRDQDLQGRCLLPYAQMLAWVKRVQALEKAIDEKGK